MGTKKKVKARKKVKRLTLVERIKQGDIIAVYWRDITLHDKTRAEELSNKKYIKCLTNVPPTITYGRFMGIDNDCLAVSQEYCTDDGSDATMVEIIPIGCVTRVEVFKVKKVIKCPA